MDAVAQTTKHGYVFLFDRTNGKPLFPIEYYKFPPSTLDGEVASETQPLPTKPAPFARQRLTEDLLTNRTPEAHQWALERFRTFRSEGQFVEPGNPSSLVPSQRLALCHLDRMSRERSARMVGFAAPLEKTITPIPFDRLMSSIDV